MKFYVLIFFKGPPQNRTGTLKYSSELKLSAMIGLSEKPL